MQIKLNRLDLTYCTNIHAGEGWNEVEASLAEYAVPLKARLSPDAPFGLGLRLSAVAASELLEGDRLAHFRSWLDTHGLYVALINGFPYGAFHGEVVKSKVFAPDWRDRRRVEYTLNLVRILSKLLPEGMDGGISTLAFSYKPWVENAAEAWPIMLAHLAEVVAELVGIRERTGLSIHLDIEPEPDGLLESTAELIEFFNGPLIEIAAPLLAERLARPVAAARTLLQEHVQVCFDTCHMAIQFEDAAESLLQLKTHGIAIGRLQVSSALTLSVGLPEQVETSLAPFLQERIYLHQVVVRDAAGRLHRYRDLREAVTSRQAGEWRIHFHLPLFTARHGAAASTQPQNRALLALAADGAICSHLEIETYTWHVLPEALRLDLLPSIEREFRWVLGELRYA